MKPTSYHLSKINTILSYLFSGIKINEIFSEIEIHISPRTKRIKEIYDNSTNDKILLFTLRNSDGRLLPTIEASNRILKSGFKKNRIFVKNEVASFIAKGKSCFCKHVVKVDPSIYPNSEVFILDENEKLLAVGSANQPSYAIMQLKDGIAVKPRKSIL